MRLRVGGGGRVGGEPASVAVVVEGEAWVMVLAELSAESLAAEERVTLGDMGKSLLGSTRKCDTVIASGDPDQAV